MEKGADGPEKGNIEKDEKKKKKKCASIIAKDASEGP